MRDAVLLKEWRRAFHELRAARKAEARTFPVTTKEKMHRTSRAKAFLEAAEIALAYSNGPEHAEEIRALYRDLGKPARGEPKPPKSQPVAQPP